MNIFGKAALTALLLAGAGFTTTAPAKADVAIGFSFGLDGGYFRDPCAYYDYYDAPPPWGLPPDYCDYPVYFEPVYIGGSWYRGPIYYRWYDGGRVFWVNGRWRRDEWRGPRPDIRWTDRGGWHARSGWSRDGWNRGGWNRGDDNRGGDWNRGDGNRNDWGRGDYNRNDGNRGDRGGWYGGSNSQYQHSQSGNGWSGGNRSGWQGPQGGNNGGGHYNGGQGGGGNRGGGDHGGGDHRGH